MIEDLAGRFSREARERSRAIEQFTLRLDTVEQSAESLRQAHENARSLLDGRIAALQGAIELERGSLPPWWEYNDYVDPSLRTVL
ncbi:MAG: hypothetical protein ACE5EC_06525, partial [Phycisphaerae bacterium]